MALVIVFDTNSYGITK